MDTSSCPVVLIPGFMLDESLWDDFRNHLPENWVVVNASLSGGQTISEIARHIAEHAPERFLLIGFSLGGYIARQLAADYPERVGALVIVASSLREDTEQQTKLKQQAINALSDARFKGLSNSTIANSLHPHRAADTDLISRIKQMGNRLGYKALAIQSVLDRSGVPTETIACPTLVVASTSDALRSLDEAQELVRAIPNASLQIIDDAGHMIPLERPRELAATIVHWLGSQRIHHADIECK
ncbi:alpha/beta hydrolase [Microbulbifer bruguierae]|uniref:Alpha/beta hydrolase n=1 Tax=Microbulbifer bruguierae TaxID=3029061 RepID=A0ABY8NEP6_9GAMM|nr:alpha/beta hydrolase [Microbulbifer bruguierae]WGL17391.1 alpha/beta hydrolase [Microbulbifer bruguierae]